MAIPQPFFCFYPDEGSLVHHFIPGKEKEQGVQATIFRDVGRNPLTEEYQSYMRQVDKLYDSKSEVPKDVVFFQISQTGKPFERFDNEKAKLVMSYVAYVQLLLFYRNDYEKAVARIQAERKKFDNPLQRFLVHPEVSISGPVNCLWKINIDCRKDLELSLTVDYVAKTKAKSVYLKYNTDEYALYLPHAPMVKLAESMDKMLSTIQTRECASPSKRSKKY